MREFLFIHFGIENVLFILILIARLGDIGSTYLVTPKLQLEMNPIAKKLGWRFAWATLLVALVPYYSTALGVVVLVPSLLVSASNVRAIWFVRSYGEAEYRTLLEQTAKNSRLSQALVPTFFSAAFLALIGLTMLLFSPDPSTQWDYWFGLGFLSAAFALLIHSTVFYVRLFKRVKQSDQT